LVGWWLVVGDGGGGGGWWKSSSSSNSSSGDRRGKSRSGAMDNVFFSVQDGFLRCTMADGGRGTATKKKQCFLFSFFFPKVAVSGIGDTPAAVTAHGNCCFRLLRRCVLCARRNTTTHNIDGRRDVT